MDVRITTKSGKIREVKSVGVSPRDVLETVEDEDTSGHIFWKDIETVEITGSDRPMAGIFYAKISLKTGTIVNKKIKNWVFSWEEGGIHYQMPGDKIKSVTVTQP